MYAVIDDRKGQFTVRQGDVILCDPHEQWNDGDEVTFDRVLLLSNEGDVRIGKPFVDGASVTGEVLGQSRAARVVSFRFKRRKNVRVKNGHRQPYTRVRITGIQG